MLDSAAVEKAEREIDRFLDSQASKRQGEDAANLAAMEERARTERKAATMREENRKAWIEHYRKLTDNYLKLALDARRRSREIAKLDA